MTSQPVDDEEEFSKTAKLESILEKDEAVKSQLLDIYKEVKTFLSEHPDETLEEEINARFPSYKTSLDKYPKELQGDERPLVVTGETSAGKSTLLNLLLGFEVLPSAVLASTGAVCRIRSSKEKKAEIYDRNNVLFHTISMANGDEKKFKKDLKDYISPEKNRDTHNVKYVDIYWPIPFLRKNIMVVDTPGIGESEGMTDRVLEYLPNAIALIYVIEPSRGGGLAEDRIVPLLKRQNNEKTEGMKEDFDPSCALFVCNKWDLVKTDEDDNEEDVKVKKFIKNKLEKCWPHFDTKQLHCISALKALKKKKKGKPLPDEYEKLHSAVENLVEVSLGAKSRQHIIWLQKFMTHIMISVNSHLKSASLTSSQRVKQMKMGEVLLKQLEESCVTSKEKLVKEAESECQRLSKEVNAHIHDENNRDEMFPWGKTKLPESTEDLDNIRFVAYGLIQRLVGQEVNKALRKYGGVDTQERLLSKVKVETESIRKARMCLEKLLQEPDITNLDEDRSDCESLEDLQVSDDDPIFSKGAVAVIAVTAPIWFPLALVGGLIAVPLGITVIAIKDKFQVSKYNRNKIKYMNKWGQKYLDGYGEEDIYKILKETFFGDFYKKSDELFNEELPQTIAGCQKLFSNLKAENRTRDSIYKRYKPMERACLAILSKVNALVCQQPS